MAFLPINLQDMESRGWDELDFLFITGDAYVDHPSFGTAILTRLLEHNGYRVGVCAQPSIHEKDSLKGMGTPRFGVFVSSGVVDSMVDNYTAGKRKRHDDRYSAGGTGGKRPDRALIRYCNMVREQFGEIPLVIGGLEASLRRFAHYDFWDNKVRRSILQDTRADILIYGMGEKPILEVADLLSKRVNVRKISSIRGTCVFLKKDQLPKSILQFLEPFEEYRFSNREYSTEQLRKGVLPQNEKYMILPSFDEVSENKTAYAAAFKAQYEEQDPANGKTLIQRHSERMVIQNPPQALMTTKEMDAIYALPYERTYHPVYAAQGGVPSIEEVKFSITSQRGCFGGCHFCAITFHQGRIIQHRSPQSIVEEAKHITMDPEFKGYIHDVGGPTANFYNPACEKQIKGSACKNRSCLYPSICPSLKVDHTDYLDVLKKVRAVDGIKKVFIRSGIRFDYVMADRKTNFLEELCKNHISGQLKVAPEHICDNVLDAMGKPRHAVYEEFKEAYQSINKRLDKNQFLVPYLISGHPGCTLKDAITLALDIKKNRVMPEQVQDFYPTPGTISTTMYYTGINPVTFAPVHIPDEIEKTMQRALLQYSKPENRSMVERALSISKRQDLVGYGPDCLLHPYRAKKKNRIVPDGKDETAGAEDKQTELRETESQGGRNPDRGNSNPRNRRREAQSPEGTGRRREGPRRSAPQRGTKTPESKTDGRKSEFREGKRNTEFLPDGRKPEQKEEARKPGLKKEERNSGYRENRGNRGKAPRREAADGTAPSKTMTGRASAARPMPPRKPSSRAASPDTASHSSPIKKPYKPKNKLGKT